MNNAAQNFIEALKEKNMRVERMYEIPEGKSVVVNCLEMNAASFDIYVVFDDDCKTVDIRVLQLAIAPQDRIEKVMTACNSINRTYKWAKFYVEDDGDVCMECDTIVDVATCGDICLDLLINVSKVIYKAFPEIVKAVYA